MPPGWPHEAAYRQSASGRSAYSTGGELTYVADEWRKIAARYLSAYVLGFTATPERGDGTPLGDIFMGLVVVAQTRELIALGHLCAVDVVSPERETTDLCAEPIDAWRTHARGRPTVIFCASVDAARQLADGIATEGTRAAAIWGDMDDDDRADALGRFALGDLDVLCETT